MAFHHTNDQETRPAEDVVMDEMVTLSSVKIPKEVKDRIRKHAKREDRKLGSAVRRILVAGLNALDGALGSEVATPSVSDGSVLPARDRDGRMYFNAELHYLTDGASHDDADADENGRAYCTPGVHAAKSPAGLES